MRYIYKSISDDLHREVLYADLLAFMKRTSPLFFKDDNGDTFCLIHGQKVDRYNTVFINGYTTSKLYNEAMEKGLVDGVKKLTIYACMSAGLDETSLNDNRCILGAVTEYPVAFGWESGGTHPSGIDNIPTQNSEFMIGIMESDSDLIELIENSESLRNLGLTKDSIGYLRVYKR